MPPTPILVAEDDPVNRKVITRMLERLGYAPEVVRDGWAAIDRVRRGDVEIILMDVMMPEVDGIEAARRIRELGDAVHQPYIVAVTANVVTDDRDACFAAGMDAFVPKPINMEMLRDVLDKVPVRPTAGPEGIHVAFDPAVFEELQMAMGAEDESFLAELVQDFLRDAAIQIASVRSASIAGDHLAARLAAHSLKATAATFGAAALSRSAAQVRTAAEAGDTGTVMDIADRLDRELQTVSGHLRKRVAC